MRMKALCAAAGLVACLGVLATDASAQRGGGEQWVQLGCKAVGFRVDRDVVPVGRAEGRFTAIRLRVQGSLVHMRDLKVIYAGGEPDDLPVRADIRPGGQTRPIDLRGRDRSIRQIEMVYRSVPNFRGQATVCVDGLQVVAAAPPPERWVQLGCKRVGFLVDRDVIPVGRQEGRFKAIRLKAGGSDVHMLDLKVVYSNGEVDDLPVRADIRAGGQTRAIDLKGRERSIRQIEMVYRSKPSFRGQANICAEGLD
jgi:hypothetical protein